MTPADDDRPTRPGFPATRASAVREVGSADLVVRRTAFAAIAAAYWLPAYAHLRLRRRLAPDDASDLVQGFFAAALEKDWLAAFDPTKGRFRTFFRTCLEGFASNEAKAGRRQKRGGGAVHVGFDFAAEEGELGRVDPAGPDAVERACDDAWTRGLFSTALERLKAEAEAKGRRDAYEMFLRYDVDPPAAGRPKYDDLAAEFGVKNSDVVNRLAAMRRDFRRLVLDALREVSATDEEFREEARVVLGLDLP